MYFVVFSHTSDILATCTVHGGCVDQFSHNGKTIVGCTFGGEVKAWCSRYDSFYNYEVEKCDCK